MNEQTLPSAPLDNQPDAEDVLNGAADAFEAYCVRCRAQVAVENPEPVWTSRGQPGTRGTCPNCGSTVFRMGRTPAHDKLQAPPPVRVEDAPKLIANRGHKRAQPATYVNTDSADNQIGEQLAKDLESAGVHTWFDPKNATETVAWAGGVHPALRDCVQMVLVWSKTASKSESVQKAWQFFKTARKPITVVLLDTTEIPDALRRSPRFDFSQNGPYQIKNSKSKAIFRQLVQTLGEQVN